MFIDCGLRDVCVCVRMCVSVREGKGREGREGERRNQFGDDRLSVRMER